MEKRTFVLIAVLVVIAAAVAYLGMFNPSKSYTGTPVVPESTRTTINPEKAKMYPYAQEIAKPSGFVNVDNITIGSLIGKKVILVHFWTFNCIDCVMTIPYLNTWYAKYHDQGFEIIGVHTPETPIEHDINNVRRAVEKYGIKYPVVLDNDYATWGSYGNEYWPADYLIDIDGFIVYHNFGAGNYDVTEKKIQDLLKERADVLATRGNISTITGTPAGVSSISQAGSPETHFGAAQNTLLWNGQPLGVGQQTLEVPSTVLANVLYLGGTWNFTDQYAETTGNNRVVFQYNAKNVYFIASAAKATNVSVVVDGKPATDIAGPDVSGGVAMIRDERPYQLVAGTGYGDHTLELDISQPGLRAFALTFG